MSKKKPTTEADLEVWKDIPGFEGLYQASTHGRIKALEKVRATGTKHSFTRTYPEKIMKPSSSNPVRPVVASLRKDNKSHHFSVHRLIAKTFIANPQGLPCINHIDAVRHNNRVDNLEWCTHSQNSKHAFEMGIQPNAYKNGDDNPSSIPILNTETGITYYSIADAYKSVKHLTSISRLYQMLQGNIVNKTPLIRL